MSDVTEADREKAAEIMRQPPGYRGKGIVELIAQALADEREKARAQMAPGRWWRVVAADGSLWCETSDEEEARASLRTGDTLQREYVQHLSEWRDEVEL